MKLNESLKADLRTIKYIENAKIRYYEDAELILHDLQRIIKQYKVKDNISPPEDFLLLDHFE